MQNQIKEISLSKYPRVFNIETPFWEDLYKHYSGERKGINRGEYNLICSKRDVSLYAKTSMKPHARWKVSDVKKYFNIKGTKSPFFLPHQKINLALKMTYKAEWTWQTNLFHTLEKISLRL